MLAVESIWPGKTFPDVARGPPPPPPRGPPPPPPAPPPRPRTWPTPWPQIRCGSRRCAGNARP
ncbi:hypothetical protein EGJ92_20945, partial [Pseudomonas aeruginosa]